MLEEAEHLGASGYHITLGEPRNVDVIGDYGYVVVPATLAYDIRGKHLTQTDAVFTVALRRAGDEWHLAAWAWAKGFNNTQRWSSTGSSDG